VCFQDEKTVMPRELCHKDGAYSPPTGRALTVAWRRWLHILAGKWLKKFPFHPSSAQLSLKKQLAAAPKLINLAKKATLSLEKYHLGDTVARVGLVKQYSKGKVQAVIDRLLPLAAHFDDDELDVWALSSKAEAFPAATFGNYADFISAVKNGLGEMGHDGR
jgi:hypothetical protein